MSRPKGLPKTGGRQKGTRNKSTVTFRDTLDQLGFNPAEELVYIFQDKNTPVDLKIRVGQLLLEYRYCKPTSNDEPTETTRPLATMTDDQLAEFMDAHDTTPNNRDAAN